MNEKYFKDLLLIELEKFDKARIRLSKLKRDQGVPCEVKFTLYEFFNYLRNTIGFEELEYCKYCDGFEEESTDAGEE